MCNNDQWLFENMPNMFYNAHGLKRTSGIKLATGFAVLTPNKTQGISAAVYFGNYFSQGCKPVVLATNNNHRQPRLFVWTSGIGDRSNVDYYPDQRGFSIQVQVETGVITSSLAIPWIAIGY